MLRGSARGMKLPALTIRWAKGMLATIPARGGRERDGGTPEPGGSNGPYGDDVGATDRSEPEAADREAPARVLPPAALYWRALHRGSRPGGRSPRQPAGSEALRAEGRSACRRLRLHYRITYGYNAAFRPRRLGGRPALESWSRFLRDRAVWGNSQLLMDLIQTLGWTRRPELTHQWCVQHARHHLVVTASGLIVAKEFILRAKLLTLHRHGARC